MTKERILDEALKELSEFNESKSLAAEPEELLIQNNEISKLDRYLILQKFIKDGYATESSKGGTYWITFLGKMFIKEKGYVGLSKKKHNEKFETLVWLLIGAGVTIISTIILNITGKYL